MLDKFIDILDNLDDIKTYVQNTRVNAIEAVGELDRLKNEKTSLLDSLDDDLKRLGNEIAKGKIELAKREKILLEKEALINEREAEIEKRELAHEKDVENERKVSFVRATQAQLKDKLDELEVINRQLAFYKRQTEILSAISMKYCLNYEVLTIEMIEDAILSHKESSQSIVEQNPKSIPNADVPVVAKKVGRPSKKQQVEEAKRLEEEALAKKLEAERLEAKRLEEEALAKKLEAERLEARRLEEEAFAKKLEAERLEARRLEEEAIAKKLEAERLEAKEDENNYDNNADNDMAEEDTIEDVQEVEVEDYLYKGVLYYLDRGSGEIYTRLENDEIGDIVGILDSTGKVRFNKKK